MELILSQPEKEALQRLPANYKPYVELRAGYPTIGSLLDKGQVGLVKRLCLDIITISMAEQAPFKKMNEEEKESYSLILVAQSEALFNELKGKYLTLTCPELKECFRLGIRGESGPYFGMCPKTYAQFLKWWFDKEDRLKGWTKYIDEVNGFRRAEKPTLPPEWFYEKCELAYKKYKDSGDLPVSPFSYYDFTVDYLGVKSLINESDWNLVRDEGIKAYREKVKKIQIAKEWGMNPKVNTVLGNSIKEVALKRFFDKLILEGKETIK